MKSFAGKRWCWTWPCFCWFALLGFAMALRLQLRSQQVSSSAFRDFPPSGWQRTSGAPPGTHYVGSRVCAQCHLRIAATQAGTAMGQTSMTAADSPILAKHPLLKYSDGPYTLEIVRQEGREVLSASDGSRKESVPLLWAFGLGDAGQTYIFVRNGTFYESRVSYYKEADSLALTIGHDPKPPKSLPEALGRPLDQKEKFKCLPCHTSEGVFDSELQPSLMRPGVTCENCHGPGSQHVDAVEGEDLHNLRIFNPGRLDPADLNDFCGTCHRSTRDVLAANIRGIQNVRFQPYRLENSRCYDPSDKRTSCIACHDPHVNLATNLESYDPKCLACHISREEEPTSARRATPCPRATNHCVSCHMPKLSLPGAHHQFTDHFIRVYREGEPYPE